MWVLYASYVLLEITTGYSNPHLVPVQPPETLEECQTSMVRVLKTINNQTYALNKKFIDGGEEFRWRSKITLLECREETN